MRPVDPGTVVILLAAGGLTVGAVALAVFLEKGQAKRRHQAWRAIAEKRGGRFTEGHIGAFRFEPPTLEVVVDHAVVRLDLVRVQSGKHTHIYTRALAGFALGAGPVFQVYREGFFQSLGKALGGQDVVLGGDSEFDDAFIVKCADPEATRAAFTPTAKRRMVTLERPVAASDGSVVDVRIFDTGTEAWSLEALLEIAGALGSAGTERLESYAALEGARLEPARGPFARPQPPRLVFETPRAEVRAELLPASHEPKLRLRVAHDRGVAPFSVDVVGGEAPGLPRGLVSVRAEELLRRLDAVTLAGDQTSLQLTWRVAPEAPVVADGLAFLAELASGAPSEGAFR